MKTFRSACLVSTSFLTIATGVAQGADLAYKAPMAAYVAGPGYNWSGLYVGLNAGGAWDHGCWNLSSFRTSTGDCPSASGAVAGGQIGYRYQFLGSFVIGIEGQGDWADITGDNTDLITGTTHRKTDALGLFTGQVGYAYGPALGYIKGGAGAVNTQTTMGFSGLTINTVRFGPSIGVGFDYMFAPNWSAGIAYDHLFLGHQDTLTQGVTALTVKSDIDLVTVRLNYKLTVQ